MSGPGSPALDRSRPPAPGSAHPFHFPSFERRRLRNGLKLVTARPTPFPLVYADLIVPAGAHHVPPGSAGLATLTAALLDEGTQSSTAVEIASRIDRIGTSLATGADWHVGYLSLLLLSQHLDEGLGLMLEVATSPTFPEQEVERLRREQLAELMRRRDRPGTLAEDHLFRVLYGDSAYGSPLGGTEGSLGSFDRRTLQGFYDAHYALSSGTLIVVGDIDAERLARRVESLLGDIEPQPEPETFPVEVVPREGISILLVDRPGAAQTDLRLGHAAISRLNPDYIPLAVLNVLLGGKFTSRINLNLRERHGYTYGASSRLYARKGPAPFVVSSAVSTEAAGAAAREVLHELRRIREKPVEPEELEDTKSYLTGVFPYTLQTLDGLGRRLENLEIFDLPEDYYERYLTEIETVDQGKLLEVARRQIHPEQIAVVAVGPVDELRPQFEKLGNVEVVGAEKT